MTELPEDPRIRPGICGTTYTGGTGLEWICIKDPHDTEYRRHSVSDRHVAVSRTGAHPERPDGIQAPAADRHYFVRRWPNRDS
jgi:hypothetical protein